MINFLERHYAVIAYGGIPLVIALIGILIKNASARRRDTEIFNRDRFFKFVDFSNSTIAALNNFEIKAFVTINKSFSAGEALINDINRIVSKRKVVVITELWEQYKYETFYNSKPGKKNGESISTGTSDEEQRKKAIYFLNKIVENIKLT